MPGNLKRAALALFLLIVPLIIGALYSVATSPTASAQEPSVTFPDPQLPDVAYTVTLAEDCSGGCYRLTNMQIVPDLGVHIRGSMIGGSATSWTAGWPGTTVTIPNASDFVMGRGACFFDENGGPHFAFAGTDSSKSDVVRLMGLPICGHREFYLTWTYSTSGATPTAIPGSSGWTINEVETTANCGLTRIMGTLLDAQGNPIIGTRIEASWSGVPDTSNFTGHYPVLGPSGWEFYFDNKPVGHTWHVRLTASSGAPLSPWLPITTTSHCTGAGAANTVQVIIQAVAHEGTPTATPPPTMMPTSTPAPASPTASPGAPRATVTPTLEPPTATATPPVGLGGRAIYTAFLDNSILHYQCAEGVPVARPVPPEGQVMGIELYCEPLPELLELP